MMDPKELPVELFDILDGLLLRINVLGDIMLKDLQERGQNELAQTLLREQNELIGKLNPAIVSLRDALEKRH